MINYTYLESPLGRLLVAESEKGICRIELQAESEESLLAWQERWFPGETVTENRDSLIEAEHQLSDYFTEGLKQFSLPLDLRTSPFRKRVLAEVQRIPYGETSSYKQIAERIGRPSAIRAVGGANAHNPLPIIIPCHRVVAHDGTLGGYGGGLDLKARLLNLEGAL